mgnify:CR=1 FL=1
MKASSSSKSRETDASSLSEHQTHPPMMTEVRFRFRASALKQSPSSDALMIHHDGEEEEEEEDFSEDQELARYVEPPELPAFAMHKVFGKGVGTLEKRFLLT